MRIKESYLINVSSGIFQKIFTFHGTDWFTLGELKQLDMEYLYLHSADKIVSPYVKNIRDLSISDDNAVSKLAEIISRRYFNNWNNIKKALETEYKPLENYSMIENRSPDLYKDVSNTAASNEKIKKGTTTTSKENQNANTTADTFNKIVPYDDDEAVTVSSIESVGNASKTDTTNDVVVAASGEDENISSSTGTAAEHEHGTEQLTRTGNIGVTTSQQMLEAEVNLRVKQDLIEIIMHDIDKILTLSIY